ncbi:MAG: hypothetical protein K0S07_1595 [Chlamydiales bacterium]|jgi:hypothetical protein|nr:hypothetical protein [Chlamydiales bacterium]
MSINFSQANTALAYASLLRKSLYEYLDNSAQSTELTRLSGIFFGLADGAINLASKVSYVAEAAFKSLANIFGSPFSSKFSFLQGMHQLANHVPESLALLVTSPVQIVVTTAVATAGVLITPGKYAKVQLSLNQKVIAEFGKTAETVTATSLKVEQVTESISPLSPAAVPVVDPALDQTAVPADLAHATA